MKPFSSLRSRATAGWTLIELLVAMTLGLLIIAGIGQIYLAAKRSYEIQTSIGQLQDVGRYATEVLTQDIRRAGYWGMMTIDPNSLITASAHKFPSAVTSFGQTCPNGTNEWGRMIGEKLFGLNDTAAGYDCVDSNWKRGDILTVRYAEPSPVTTYDADALYVHTAPLEASLVFGDPATCPSTTMPPGCSFFDYVDDTSFPSDKYTYKVAAHAYYVTDSSTATQCGDSTAPALPALARETLSSAPSSPGFPIKTELVTGVEQLQFQYGVDTDADIHRSVNEYMNADAVGTWNPLATSEVNWQAVRSVRFWVLVRSECPDGSYTDNAIYKMGDISYAPSDHFRRTLYTSTVALRN